MNALTWAVLLAFLAWSLRLEALEGYVYPLASGFQGDFHNTLREWDGRGLFYGPIFVLEFVLLAHPGLLGINDFARLDYVLFAVAFVCTWLALFNRWHPKLLALVACAWLASHVTVALFAGALHLEVLEVALISAATVLMARGRRGWAGVSLGLAIATKTLPFVFVPYLVVLRQWRALAASMGVAAVLVVAVCAYQRVSLWDGLAQLVAQGPNLTKIKATAEEFSLRAYFIRLETGSGEVAPTPDQAQLAIVLSALVALVAAVFTAGVLWRTNLHGRGIGLAFGCIEATMLAVTPSSHIQYFVFLLPAWTAVFAELVNRPLTRLTAAAWVSLVASYVLIGFDLPFVLSDRLFGIGQVVLTHWLDLNPWGLVLAFVALSLPLFGYYRGDAPRPGRATVWGRVRGWVRLARRRSAPNGSFAR